MFAKTHRTASAGFSAASPPTPCALSTLTCDPLLILNSRRLVPSERSQRVLDPLLPGNSGSQPPPPRQEPGRLRSVRGRRSAADRDDLPREMMLSGESPNRIDARGRRWRESMGDHAVDEAGGANRAGPADGGGAFEHGLCLARHRRCRCCRLRDRQGRPLDLDLVR